MSQKGNALQAQEDLKARLTAREIEVLKLVGEGHSTKNIADSLGISFKTAACHRCRLMAKVGVHDSVSLVRWAIREGVIEP
jgi:DNA-binding NarL/FixJ family response regulator